MSEQQAIDIPDKVRREVAAVTASPKYKPVHGSDTPEGLRLHPGPVREGTTVWVHASGFWRPAVVLRAPGKRGAAKARVVHSTPSNPTRMYVKNEPIENLRVKA